MSHGDAVTKAPEGFTVTATSEGAPVAAFEDTERRFAGVQYHPEVHHSPHGQEVLRRFLHDIAGMRPQWTTSSIVDEQVTRIRAQIGDGKAICGLSGGVDSAVAAALVQRAIGDRLTCVFVDHGLLRAGERAQVERDYVAATGINLVTVDARERFLNALAGVTDPEEKRKIIGREFIRVFEQAERDLKAEGDYRLPGAGHALPGRRRVRRRRGHREHQVAPQRRRPAGRPAVRAGRAAARAVQGRGPPRRHRAGPAGDDRAAPAVPRPRPRHPDHRRGRPDRPRHAAPGRRHRPRGADARPVSTATIWQCPVVLLADVRSVGVQGDGRTYGHPIVLRPVSSEDAMTADWTRLPYEVLERISTRITNEVAEVNRVVLDVTSKPPGTIEWE